MFGKLELMTTYCKKTANGFFFLLGNDDNVSETRSFPARKVGIYAKPYATQLSSSAHFALHLSTSSK